MKELTYNEKIAKIAKILVKEFKANKEATGIFIADELPTYNITKDGETKRCVVFRFNEPKNRIEFGDQNKMGVASITIDIATEIEKIINLPKKCVMFKDVRTDTYWGMWSHRDYRWVKKFTIITPCKEFGLINKKLVKLGCKAIPFNEWFGGSVFGKRSSYSMSSKTYWATDKAKCDKVLEFLKGKKKLSYELKREEQFENREYGERYETEWDGYLNYALVFTDFKGNKFSI